MPKNSRAFFLCVTRSFVRGSSRSLHVAEPPILSPRLHGGDPATQRIERDDYRDPDQIDTRQPDAEAFRKETVVRQELLCCETLREAEQDRDDVDEIEMRHVERQRRAPERQQELSDRAAQTFDESAGDRGRA